MTTLRKLLLPLLILFGAAPAWAQPSDADRATARNLAREAQSALEAEDYETALSKFRTAEELFHAPTLVLGMARAYRGLDKYVEAMESYHKVIREKLPESASDAFHRAQADAKEEVKGLDEKIAWVVLEVEGPDDPTVTLDGKPISAASLGVKRAVNPGEHVLAAHAQGWAAGEKAFAIQSGEQSRITLRIEESDEPAIASGKDAVQQDDGILGTVGWAALGVGAAGLVIGGVTGGLAIGKHGELEDNCPGGICEPDQQGTLDDYRTLGTVSTVGFIVGGVLAATGVVLIVIDVTGDEQEPAATALELDLGPAAASARLHF